GPGGCQAAEVAAKRGHNIILCEKANRLGGQIAVSMYNGWKYLITYYENVLKHLGVDIRFGTTVTPEYVEQLKPDAVVVATGGTPVKMNVKGRDLPNVVTYFDVLSGKVKPGKRVVVIGWFCGAGETVEFLGDRDVTVVSSQPESAFLQDLEFTRRCVRMLTLFNKRKPPLTMHYDATVKEISPEGPLVASGGKEQTISCDTVVMAVGIRSDRELADALKTKVPSLYVIGDCLMPRKLKDAVHEGFRVGNIV
ncbi:MAG: FAD-dependent oxidoreductase, partial [Candidatus Bathyarchaeia archaeon]